MSITATDISACILGAISRPVQHVITSHSSFKPKFLLSPGLMAGSYAPKLIARQHAFHKLNINRYLKPPPTKPASQAQ